MKKIGIVCALLISVSPLQSTDISNTTLALIATTAVAMGGGTALMLTKQQKPIILSGQEEKVANLVRIAGASSLDEAINNVKLLQERDVLAQELYTGLGTKDARQAVEAIFNNQAGTCLTAARMLGFKSFENKIVELIQKSPEAFVNKGIIQAINNELASRILELKFHYFEALKSLSDFHGPNSNVLLAIIQAKQNGSSNEEIVKLVPDKMLPHPNFKLTNEQKIQIAAGMTFE